jgi:hypothetical protein
MENSPIFTKNQAVFRNWSVLSCMAAYQLGYWRPCIIWSIRTCASLSGEIEQNEHRWKTFVIWRSLSWLFGLVLEPVAPKPDKRRSILLDQYPSKSLARTQKTSPRQLPEFVRAFPSP